jgi:glycosyltransferase involved in cell wall biosynthesis
MTGEGAREFPAAPVMLHFFSALQSVSTRPPDPCKGMFMAKHNPEVAPTVSIVLATYDRAALLPRAIESVLCQTWPHWELIVVDDGSRDDTPALLAAFCRRDSRIRCLRQRNQGLVVARNHGAQLATAPWLTFLDSDDEFTPDHLERRLAWLAGQPDVDFIHGGYRLVGDDLFVPDVRDPSRRIPISECVVGGTFFLRTAAFHALGGFRPPDFGCDYEFFQRAQTRLRIEKVEFPTYVYHRDVQNTMCKRPAGDNCAPESSGEGPSEAT